MIEYDLDRAEHEGLGALVDVLAGADTVLLATGYGAGMLPQSKAAGGPAFDGDHHNTERSRGRANGAAALERPRTRDLSSSEAGL